MIAVRYCLCQLSAHRLLSGLFNTCAVVGGFVAVAVDVAGFICARLSVTTLFVFFALVFSLLFLLPLALRT